MRVTGLVLTTVLGAGLGAGAAYADNVQCAANSVCVGTSGNDVLTGTSGSEDIRGLAGHDVLRGRGGVDFLDGGPGPDRLAGGAGEDAFVFFGGWGTDTVVDSAGFDSLDFAALRVPVVVELAGAGDNAVAGANRVHIAAGTIIEQSIGGIGDDVIRGNFAANSLEGGDGDDLIFGRRGDDGMGGGRGNDRMVGGPGRDIIVSRAGDDVIHAADGEVDNISCGDGADRVIFDLGIDVVSGNCEQQIPR